MNHRSSNGNAHRPPSGDGYYRRTAPDRDGRGYTQASARAGEDGKIHLSGKTSKTGAGSRGAGNAVAGGAVRRSSFYASGRPDHAARSPRPTNTGTDSEKHASREPRKRSSAAVFSPKIRIIYRALLALSVVSIVVFALLVRSKLHEATTVKTEFNRPQFFENPYCTLYHEETTTTTETTTTPTSGEIVWPTATTTTAPSTTTTTSKSTTTTTTTTTTKKSTATSKMTSPSQAPTETVPSEASEPSASIATVTAESAASEGPTVSSEPGE